jgi:hypothetical protein
VVGNGAVYEEWAAVDAGKLAPNEPVVAVDAGGKLAPNEPVVAVDAGGKLAPNEPVVAVDAGGKLAPVADEVVEECVEPNDVVAEAGKVAPKLAENEADDAVAFAGVGDRSCNDEEADV